MNTEDEIKVGDVVKYGNGHYVVAELKQFPHVVMIGIYDEVPASNHIDYLNPSSVTKVSNGGGVTKLPDGSAFFTATIMSKDDALALPLKERPLNYRLSGDLYHAVFEAVGAASMCWNPKPSDEVFDSSAAEKIAVDLCFKIANAVEDGKATP